MFIGGASREDGDMIENVEFPKSFYNKSSSYNIRGVQTIRLLWASGSWMIGHF